ncbi:hypothetical protein FHR24_001704 [Wenyingzhuangia heitensis]|uniref:Uncharacterized protein n=1 Tax=Wenyingzhuangia heitensis TaxID=1487859 RepID=A0ABX0UBR4_9FLAO|nr:hypothetical protein [Wenyingzhuangia heitensis]NIJ45265.1 hypothetical protein [Wenyingzhuangia heitensis]
MNFKKILFAFALIISTTVFSQEWAEKQAKKLTTKLNTSLISADENLKLNDEQSTKVTAIYKDLMVEKSNAKIKLEKAGTFNKEDFWKSTFPIQKAANEKIRDLLSVTQKPAFNSFLRKK